MMTTFVLLSVVSAIAIIAYFTMEWLREPLLELLEDWLYWIVPSGFLCCAVFFACCAVTASTRHGQPSGDGKKPTISTPPSEAPTTTVLSTEPETQAGIRVVIIEAPAPSPIWFTTAIGGGIEADLERQFRTAGIRLLADKGLRANIVQELHAYQKGKALYDPATLKQVEPGHFHGATYAVFWSVAAHGTTNFECRLVRLRTAEIIASTGAPIAGEDGITTAVEAAATGVLAEIVDVTILAPMNESTCGHKITVRGRASYLPHHWSLWVTLVPDGLSNHYPQRAATMQRNGSFVASEVYLGDGASAPQSFFLYTVMTDGEGTARIKEYLANPNTVGLDIQNWPSEHRRIIGPVTVHRSAQTTTGCTGGQS